ncbi:photosystem II stability/assembly factor-like uncharacterized protein/uncharacterized membrane protein [Pontibacter aydingkolensis]|uniref:T9SS type A sorting domain-containing protein n=1 Tax=Pontibacter aydingkolensis TaxID=1911536 RepID=A0ABS7CTQ5_9BACT|nr:Ig-like domain-containing protein [Pontibacter aydingkolensis]MBW7466872.1 T9SS type A sorting domain-containing protein [Pontibacter aydingkolensis]
MKKHILITIFSWLILLTLPAELKGQNPWEDRVGGKQNPNFFEIQQSFEEYWQENTPTPQGDTPKGRGYKQFKRWEWFWEPRVDKDGNFPDYSKLMVEWQKYRTTRKSSGENNIVPFSNSGNWVNLGPSSSDGGYSGVGRLNCIAFHPTDPNTFWVGSPAGGLWKTTTGGNSWSTLTDNLPVMGVSAIVVDPTNPNIIYIATGDRDGGNTYSVGVLKSTNGGVTWNTTGLNYDVLQYQQVKGLIMHPSNSRMLLAATSDGIHSTTDGGNNWKKEQSGDFQEIIFKPGDPTTVYASTIGNAQIYRSTNTGDSWAQITNFSNIYRIALAVTPANPSVVGALCSDYYNFGFGGYYTSTNSGETFELTYGTEKINLLHNSYNGSGYGGQGHYDLCIAISPTNENEIYVGGINTWKSMDGGTNWTLSTMWHGGTSAPVVHADKHAMAYNPLNPSTLYQCNDGGLYKTINGGESWTDLSNGLEITQFYRLGNSETNSNLTLVGAQDNGTKLRNNTTFTDVLGGDGMEAIIDYTNANIMYGSLQNGVIRKSTDGGVNWTGITKDLPSGSWVTPYVIDPVNPQTLYAGLGGIVYKTTNRGESWTPISDFYLIFGQITSLAVANSNPNILLAASRNYMIKTINGGENWFSISIPEYYASISSIEIHPTNPDIIWLTYSGYIEGVKIFRSDNGGDSWTNITGSLPNLPVNTIEHDKNTGVLYLGNDLGVFVLHPDMKDWQPFDTGLPNVIVNELEIQYSSGRLRAATYGRGLWESDLFVTNQPPSVSITSPANGAAFAAGATVSIAASAEDKDGTVAKVEFFAGEMKLGEDLEAPYSYDWSGVTQGSYTLSAKAIDNMGSVNISAPLSIVVNGGNNQPPSVSITSPANGAAFAAGATVSIAASAEDKDGTVAKVEFFAGEMKLGEDLEAPYSYDWSGLTAGSYTLTARATDNMESTNTSSHISITVSGGASPEAWVSQTHSYDEAAGRLAVNWTLHISEPQPTLTKYTVYHSSTDNGAVQSWTWDMPAGQTSIGATYTYALSKIGTTAELVMGLSPGTKYTLPNTEAKPKEVRINVAGATGGDPDAWVSQTHTYNNATERIEVVWTLHISEPLPRETKYNIYHSSTDDGSRQNWTWNMPAGQTSIGATYFYSLNKIGSIEELIMGLSPGSGYKLPNTAARPIEVRVNVSDAVGTVPEVWVSQTHSYDEAAGRLAVNWTLHISEPQPTLTKYTVYHSSTDNGAVQSWTWDMPAGQTSIGATYTYALSKIGTTAELVMGLSPGTKYTLPNTEAKPKEVRINVAGATGGGAPTITTETISMSTLCAGSNISIAFSTTGNFGGGNNFIAQLSDATGSFANPITIGTSTVSPIGAVIPSGTLAGTAYKVRVIASSPATIGSNNGTNITINSIPAAPSATPIARCGAGPLTLVATGGKEGRYRWYTSQTGGTAIAGATEASYLTPNLSNSTTYYVSVLSDKGCESIRTGVTATINSEPEVSLAEFSQVCSSVTSMPLTGGQPTGGIYSGLGVQNGTFNAAAAGNGIHTITYTYTASNGCTTSAIQNITVSTCADLGLVNVKQDFVVYPNPTTGTVHVEAGIKAGKQATIRVFDSTGKLVYQQLLQSSKDGLKHTITLKDKANGLYLLQVESENGSLSKRIQLN